MNDCCKVKIFSFLPRGVENRRKENMFAALNRIGFDADQPKQARHGRADPLTQQLPVVPHIFRRRSKGFQDRHRYTGVATGRIDCEVSRVAQTLYARPILPPFRQTFLPQFGLRLGKAGGRQALLASVILIDPRLKVFAFEARKRQE